MGSRLLERDAPRAAALVALLLALYGPALGGSFVWDDHSILPDNPLIHGTAGLRDIWTTTGRIPDETHWWPITYTVLWIQHQLWGFAPLGYHVVNVLLHAGICLMIVRLARRLELPGAWLVAGLFAVHPVHVEAVAWIDELKDLLATFFYLLAADTFLAGEGRRRRARWLAAALLVAAMLSKSVAVTLPVGLALALWYRRGRLSRRDLASLAPVAAVALAFGALDAFLTGRSPQELAAVAPSLAARVLHAAMAFWFYAWKLVWPATLSVLYPAWDVSPVRPLAWIALAGGATVTLALWFARNRIGRGPLACWLFYAVTLSPMLGLVHFTFLELSPAADRYQYLASLGPMLAASAWTARWVAGAPGRARLARAAPVAAVLGLLCVLTWRQAGLFRDQAALFAHAMTIAPDSYMATSNYGGGLMLQGRYDEAVAPLRKAVAQNPRDKASLANLGMILMGADRLDEARVALEQAVAVDPDYVPALSRLAVVFLQEQRLADARPLLEHLLSLRPDDKTTLTNLAYALGGLGDTRRQTTLYRKALALEADRPDPDILSNLAWVLATHGDGGRDADEALTLARRAIDLATSSGPEPRHLNTLGVALEATGHQDEALETLARALTLARQRSDTETAAKSEELLHLFGANRKIASPPAQAHP